MVIWEMFYESKLNNKHLKNKKTFKVLNNLFIAPNFFWGKN
jgi:hypothetical protein